MTGYERERERERKRTRELLTCMLALSYMRTKVFSKQYKFCTKFGNEHSYMIFVVVAAAFFSFSASNKTPIVPTKHMQYMCAYVCNDDVNNYYTQRCYSHHTY